MMDLTEIKRQIMHIEPALGEAVFMPALRFERDGFVTHVALTNELRKAAKKDGVWKSIEMLTALKNASYGFDPSQARSPGGSDGIFLLDRNYRPANSMMKKVFERFLDKPGSKAMAIAQAYDREVSELKPIRLVSHHLRLLGVLIEGDEDWIVLVDCDKEGK